jgi:hypothetical protein
MFTPFFRKAPFFQISADIHDKVTFKVRIAFIGNKETTYPERLSQEGYNITRYNDILNMDDFIRKEYHVVILDVLTSGKNLSPNEGGWGLLKYLKENHPHIIVIISIGADYPINQYYKLATRADDVIDISIEFLDFKEALDNSIKKVFSADYHLWVIKSKLIDKIPDSKSLHEISRIIENYGGNESKMKRLLKKYGIDSELIKTILLSVSVLNKFKTLIAS